MIGNLLADRYHIIEKVGIGGMAVVYKAQDQVLDRTVAVKLMLPQYASDLTFAERFRREAQSAANLQSPYIVSIYDWGQDGDTYYIIMEYVRGVDLKSAVEQRGAVNQRKVAQIGSQVCSALSVAHAAGIIHRDIKSQNIMIQTNGDAKVMDFGIAHAVGSAHMTQTGSVLGTAHYVSPEQAQGKELTPASDIYSLGVVLYEAATGRLPFEGTEAVSVALRQVNEQPVPPREINPDIDAAFEAIILKAMDKRPENRFRDCDEMRQALNAYLSGRPILVDSLATGEGVGAAATTVMDQQQAAGSGTSVMPNVRSSRANAAAAREQQGFEYYNDYKKPGSSGVMSRKKKIASIVSIILVLCIGGGVALGLTADKVRVPSVLGLDEAAATAKIQEEGLALGSVTEEYSDDYEEGKVCKQDPEPSKLAKKNSKVNLVISLGAEEGDIEVPDLTNMSEGEAIDAIESLGLVAKQGEDVESDTVPKGKVAQQSPKAGEKVHEGATITYHISTGAEEKEVPDVVGMSESDARLALAQAGFEVTSTTAWNDDVASGYVISQNPAGKSKRAAGEYVTLIVSSGSKPTQAPQPTEDTGGGDDEGGGGEGE